MNMQPMIYRAVALMTAVSTLTAGLANTAWGHHRPDHQGGKPTPTASPSPTSSPTPVMVTVTLDVENPLSPKRYDPCPVQVLEGSGPEAVLDAAKAAGCIGSYEIRYQETPWGPGDPYLACVDSSCRQVVAASFAAFILSEWRTVLRGFIATEGATLRPSYQTYVCTFGIDTYWCNKVI